jgi:cell wall assembly regulator SMI1
MSLVNLIRTAISEDLTHQDGESVQIDKIPPLSPAEIDAFGASLPCPLPSDIRELLAFCRGFEGATADVVDFTGQRCNFGHEAIFPHGLPIAGDGFGNFWVVDLLPTSTHWGPIYFACHDAPVVLLQSPSLEHFLLELFRCNRPPYKSLVNDVHDDRLFNVWRTNPGVISQADCLGSGDQALRSFASGLAPSFQIVDLRKADVGFGFSWGRYGPDTIVRRCGHLPIFAYQRPAGGLDSFERT